MDKERKNLVERLDIIFPKMEMSFDAEPFNLEEHGCIRDCAPPYYIDWNEFLDKLFKNGLKISNSKQSEVCCENCECYGIEKHIPICCNCSNFRFFKTK